jgi:transcription initiation factor TFIID TATA-box-binding protein
MKEPKAVILIFTSGKLVCAGARSEVDAERAVIKLHETLASEGLVNAIVQTNAIPVSV